MGFKRVFTSLFWMLALAAVLFLVLYVLRGRSTDVETEQITPVRAEYPVVGVMEESLHYPGTLLPERTIVVISKVSGRAEQVFIEEGQYVHQDEILLAIDSRVVELQMEQAYAAFQAADAQYR